MRIFPVYRNFRLEYFIFNRLKFYSIIRRYSFLDKNDKDNKKIYPGFLKNLH